jgi:hypothetical protein
MKKIPTDIEILEKIYRRYYDEFSAFSSDSPSRSAKVYVPIDIAELAKHFRVDVDIIFGRLYYHLEKKYGYTQSDNSKVHLFALKAGADTHCVHFPLLAAVLAGLRDEKNKHRWAIGLAIVSLVLSIISIGILLLKRS